MYNRCSSGLELADALLARAHVLDDFLRLDAHAAVGSAYGGLDDGHLLVAAEGGRARDRFAGSRTHAGEGGLEGAAARGEERIREGGDVRLRARHGEGRGAGGCRYHDGRTVRYLSNCVPGRTEEKKSSGLLKKSSSSSNRERRPREKKETKGSSFPTA